MAVVIGKYDKVSNALEYEAALKAHGPNEALKMAQRGGYTPPPSLTQSLISAYHKWGKWVKGEGVTVDGVDTGGNPNERSTLNVGQQPIIPGDPEGFNNMTGSFDMSQGGYWLGGIDDHGAKSTGVLSPALSAGMAAWKTYAAYQQQQEVAKQNKAQVQLKNNELALKAIQNNNLVSKANIYQNIGTTSANRMPTSAIAANQYRKFNPRPIVV